ncbi:MAG: RluA family pseudouridine synthase [Patescibacteria group bacterium]
MKHTWTVPELPLRKRLDIFLSEELPDMTRSHIAKLLKKGAGKVNGKPASVHEFLKEGDKVEFSDVEAKKEEPAARKKRQGHLPPLKIIDETDDWIVINKPNGLLVHPDAKEVQEVTLVDALLAHDPKIVKIGEDPSRPGIMHRLDKEASGLMVIAKSQMAYDDLKKQFAEHSVEKRYIALVYGSVAEEEGEIRFRIAHSKTKQRMAARPEHEDTGKAAWTHYKKIKQLNHATLLELDIFSGRTHQIRAHLLAFSHPIIGDPLYFRKSEDRNIKAPRLMLQCIHLSFKDPKTGTQKSYDLPPEKEFDELMKKIS